MHLLLVFSLLAPLASAIDIAPCSGNSCNGICAWWSRVSPNQCYGVEFEYIPTDWKIETRAYTGGRCSRRYATSNSNRRNNVCLSGSPTSEAAYGLVSRRMRLVHEARQETCSVDSETGVMQDCSEHVKPGFLQLEDGTRYWASNMYEDAFNELVSLPRLFTI